MQLHAENRGGEEGMPKDSTPPQLSEIDIRAD